MQKYEKLLWIPSTVLAALILALNDSEPSIHFQPWKHMAIFGRVEHGQRIIARGCQEKHLAVQPSMSSHAEELPDWLKES